MSLGCLYHLLVYQKDPLPTTLITYSLYSLTHSLFQMCGLLTLLFVGPPYSHCHPHCSRHQICSLLDPHNLTWKHLLDSIFKSYLLYINIYIFFPRSYVFVPGSYFPSSGLCHSPSSSPVFVLFSFFVIILLFISSHYLLPQDRVLNVAQNTSSHYDLVTCNSYNTW